MRILVIFIEKSNYLCIIVKILINIILMKYKIDTSEYWIYELLDIEWIDFTWVYSIVNEEKYISVILKVIDIKDRSKIITSDEWYNLISAEIKYNPNINWILSKISTQLSDNWISFYVLTTYNYWHFFINSNQIDLADKVFNNLEI